MNDELMANLQEAFACLSKEGDINTVSMGICADISDLIGELRLALQMPEIDAGGG